MMIYILYVMLKQGVSYLLLSLKLGRFFIDKYEVCGFNSLFGRGGGIVIFDCAFVMQSPEIYLIFEVL